MPKDFILYALFGGHFYLIGFCLFAILLRFNKLHHLSKAP